MMTGQEVDGEDDDDDDTIHFVSREAWSRFASKGRPQELNQ